MSLRTKSTLRAKRSQWALRGVLAASVASSGLLMTVGGTAGVIIGHRMDKQARELEQDIPGATVRLFAAAPKRLAMPS